MNAEQKGLKFRMCLQEAVYDRCVRVTFIDKSPGQWEEKRKPPFHASTDGKILVRPIDNEQIRLCCGRYDCLPLLAQHPPYTDSSDFTLEKSVRATTAMSLGRGSDATACAASCWDDKDFGPDDYQYYGGHVPRVRSNVFD